MNPIERRIREAHDIDMDKGAWEWRREYLDNQPGLSHFVYRYRQQSPEQRRERNRAFALTFAPVVAGAALGLLARKQESR